MMVLCRVMMIVAVRMGGAVMLLLYRPGFCMPMRRCTTCMGMANARHGCPGLQHRRGENETPQDFYCKLRHWSWP